MRLIVTDETYKDFAARYPDVEKDELQSILKRAKPFTEYDYWNHFDTLDSLAYENRVFTVEKRERYSFFVCPSDCKVYEIPEVIELKPDEEGVMYWIKESDRLEEIEEKAFYSTETTVELDRVDYEWLINRIKELEQT